MGTGWRKMYGSDLEGQYRPGASLWAWKDVFPTAQVMGLDVDRAALVQGQRVSSQVCNTMNVSQVEEVLEGRDLSFQLIVDDGLHTLTAQQATLRALWPYLTVGGLYIIEDVAKANAVTAMLWIDGAVAVNTGASDFAVVIYKKSHQLPIRPVHLEDVQERYAACLQTISAEEDFGSCCGRGGVFPPSARCFQKGTRHNECCTVFFVASGAVA